MSTKQILEAMRDHIEKHGWVQGKLYDEPESASAYWGPEDEWAVAVCLEGACNATYEKIPATSDWYEENKLPAGRALVTAISRLFPDRMDPRRTNVWSHIIWFNDDEQTTKEDVLLVVKHAIDESS